MLTTGLQHLSSCYFCQCGNSSRLAPTELLHWPTKKKKKKILFWEIWDCKGTRKQNFSLNHFIKGVRTQKLEGFLR